MNVAHLLGAPVVRAFSFWRVPDPASVREEVVKALAEAVERVQEAGLKPALENEHECNVGAGAEAGWILGRISSPAFGLIWDPGNEAMLGSEPFSGGYSHVRGRVTHLHLKDVDVEGNWTKVGTGIIDYPGQLRALAEDGYGAHFPWRRTTRPQAADPKERHESPWLQSGTCASKPAWN